MANGDDSDTQDQVLPPDQPTSAQEQNVNKELFGGQKPADMPTQQNDANKDLTQDTHPDPLAEERMKQHNDYQKRAEEAQKTYDTIQGNINRLNEELSNYKAPTPPTLRSYPQYPGLMVGQQGAQGTSPTAEQQDKQGNLGQFMMQVASIIAIGSAVFGRHRNPYAQITQESAIGGFLNGLAQGRKDIASEQLQNWNKAVELTDKLNKEDTEDYHNVLSNNRLTMADQHLLLSDIASARADVRMYNAASSKSLNDYFKILSDKSKARTAWVKAQLDANSKAVNKFLESTQGLTWSQDFKTKFKNSGIDPYKSHDDLLKAFEMYPISKWQADRKASGASVDTEDEGDKTGAADTGGTQDGKTKATRIILKGTTREDLDKEYQALPSGAYYEGPDGVPRTKP